MGTDFEGVTFLGAMMTGFEGASSSELLSLSSESDDEGAFATMAFTWAALGFSSSESSSLSSDDDEGSLALQKSIRHARVAQPKSRIPCHWL